MKHAYNEIYIRLVMHNLAAMFDIAINAERIDADEFANAFASSYVAQGIEKGDPNILAGKSATEMLMIILDREVEFDSVPMNRTPEYWAGWILAIVQWELNRSFKEILSAILPSFGQIRLADISSAHLQSLIDYLAANGSRADEENSEPLSAATVKRYATVFSSVMTEAHKMGYVEKDVLHKQYIEYPKIQRKSIQAYDDDEARIFFEGLANESPQIRALLLTSLLLGLRRGEVVALRWSDISFKNMSLTVNGSAFKEKGKTQSVKAPKSHNSVRTIFFSQTYMDNLLEWQNVQQQEKKLAGSAWHEQDYVFTNETGGMISVYSLTRICSRVEEKYGLRHLKLHGLRHTCGSLMIKNGVDIETVKSVFGHENIRTTQQYLTAYDSAKRNAAELLTNAIIK